MRRSSPSAVRAPSTLISGSFGGTFSFGGTAAPLAGGADLTSKGFGDAYVQAITSIRATATDEMVIAGHSEGTVDFGAGELTSAGGFDCFIAKFGR